MIIPLKFVPKIQINSKLPLIRIVTWCRQTACHDLKQWLLNTLTPYGVTRLQWVEIAFSSVAIIDANIRLCNWLLAYIPSVYKSIITKNAYVCGVIWGNLDCYLSLYILSYWLSYIGVFNKWLSNVLAWSVIYAVWLTHWGVCMSVYWEVRAPQDCNFIEGFSLVSHLL